MYVSECNFASVYFKRAFTIVNTWKLPHVSNEVQPEVSLTFSAGGQLVFTGGQMFLN